MIAATAVLAAVGAGGVAGALIGMPGSSGASTSATSTSAPKSDADAGNGHSHFGGGFGPVVGADKGVLDAAATALKLSTADLLKKLADGKTTIADVATAQGVKLGDVISAMEAVTNTDITNFVNNPLPKMPTFKGGKHGPGFGGPGFGFAGGDTFGAAAKALGITTTELFTDLGKGQSIADIAKTKNVNVDTLIGTLVSDAQSQFGAQVKAGHLSQDLATKLEANLKDHITKLVNNAFPKGMGHFGGFGHRGGPDHDGPSGGPTSTTKAPAA
jgi:hypothetical protein